jgi:hypothetical protein
MMISRIDGGDQTKVFESLAHDRVPFISAYRPRRTWIMATPILGTRNLRRWELCGTRRLLSHNPLKYGYIKRVADWPYRRFIATLSVAFIHWTGPMGLNPI